MKHPNAHKHNYTMESLGLIPNTISMQMGGFIFAAHSKPKMTHPNALKHNYNMDFLGLIPNSISMQMGSFIFSVL